MAAAPVAGSAAEWSKSAANGEGSAADWSSQKGANAEKALASELRTLWILNLVCFILHLVQGVACLAAALAVERIKNFRLPITTQFLQWTSAGPGLPVRPTQVSATLGYLPFVAVTSGFAFLSAAAHAAVLLRWADYVRGLAAGMNRFRWFEYALSSSLMIVLISMLFGVYDLFTLIGIGSINAAMCLFGDLHEAMNARKEPKDVDWFAYAYGTLAGIVPWGIIIAYIAATPNLENVPKFVWASASCKARTGALARAHELRRAHVAALFASSAVAAGAVKQARKLRLPRAHPSNARSCRPVLPSFSGLPAHDVPAVQAALLVQQQALP